jgi:hypothetical protein
MGSLLLMVTQHWAEVVLVTFTVWLQIAQVGRKFLYRVHIFHLFGQSVLRCFLEFFCMVYYLLFLIYKLMPSQIGVSEDLWIFILYFAYTPELS